MHIRQIIRPVVRSAVRTALLGLGFTALPAAGGEVLNPLVDKPPIELSVEVDRLYSAPNGQLVATGKDLDRLVIIDVERSEVRLTPPIGGVPSAVAVSPDPLVPEYYAVTGPASDTLAIVTGQRDPKGTVVTYQVSTLQLDGLFREPQLTYVVLPQTRGFDSGPAFVIYDFARENGAGLLRLLFPNTTKDVKPEAFPARLLDIGLSEVALALLPDRELVALMDVQAGYVTDNLLIDGLAVSDPAGLAAIAVNADGEARKLALVASADDRLLTLFGISEGRTPRLAAPLQIDLDPEALEARDGRRLLLTADRAMTQILVGVADSDQVQQFRRIRGGLEKLGTATLFAPVRDLAVVSLATDRGPEAVAFLSADGRQVELRAIGDLPQVPRTRGIEPILEGGVLTADSLAEVQRQLNLLGYAISIDGVFGPITRRALEDFQARYGLEVTGEPDAETLRELDDAVSGELSGAGGVDFDSTDPVQVQRLLATLNYRVGAIDGVLNAQTRAALRAFQADKGLDASGTIDAPTLEAMEAAVTELAANPEWDRVLPRFAARLKARAGEAVAPERLFALGAAQNDLGHPCFGLNYPAPEATWENAVRLAHLLMLLDRELGQEVDVVSAFRSPAYDRCIDERLVQRHGFFAAMDVGLGPDLSGPQGTSEVLQAIERLDSAGLITVAARAVGGAVHLEPRLGERQLQVSAYNGDSLGCERARDSAAAAAWAMAGSEVSGRLVQVVRASEATGAGYLVTVDLHSTPQADAEALAGQVRANAAASGATLGADAQLIDGRDVFLSGDCLSNHVVP